MRCVHFSERNISLLLLLLCLHETYATLMHTFVHIVPRLSRWRTPSEHRFPEFPNIYLSQDMKSVSKLHGQRFTYLLKNLTRIPKGLPLSQGLLAVSRVRVATTIQERTDEHFLFVQDNFLSYVVNVVSTGRNTGGIRRFQEGDMWKKFVRSFVIEGNYSLQWCDSMKYERCALMFRCLPPPSRSLNHKVGDNMRIRDVGQLPLDYVAVYSRRIYFPLSLM
jgi:hypothetical protein